MSHMPYAIRQLLREPLLHFAVLGALLLGVHGWMSPPAPAERIVVSGEVIDGLRRDHLRRTGMPPSAEEETALIRRFADNEMLIREALALGLDRGDVIVRRRLVQKMEFLLEAMEDAPPPTEDELRVHLDANADRYADGPRVSLVHVFASADRHGARAARVAEGWRADLQRGADPAGLGEPFLRGREFRLQSERDLAGIFGPELAARVMHLPAGEWSPPVASSYGVHVVRVEERRERRTPPLAEIRAVVEADLAQARRTAAMQRAMERLQQRYEVVIDRPADGGERLAVAP